MSKTSMELWIVLIVLSLLICLLILFIIVPAKPEGFTELYFSEEPKLEDGVLTLAFVISNHEGENLRYPYYVYVNSIQTIAEKVDVNNNEKQEVKVEFKLEALEFPIKISVQIEDNEIHEWIR